MRISLKLYRLLTKLYPATFRERYGAPLEQQFKDEYADVRGWRDAARLWARTVCDFARSMPALFASEVGDDARYALRLWYRHPLQTAFIVAALGIAMGANTGVFSVLNALLLRPLPFSEPERLVSLRNFGPPRDGFHEWRRRSAFLADAAAYDTVDVNLAGAGDARRVRLTETSWNFFSLLGCEPVLGRGFVEGEDVTGRTGVAVISYGLWQRLFGAGGQAIGAPIRVNGTLLNVVGVAPPGCEYPGNSELWTPTTFDFDRIPKTGAVVFFITIGRLKPELAWQQARAAFETEAYTRSPARRTVDAANRPALIGLQDELAGRTRDASLVLMSAVALLLLLACANVANLLLARTVARSSELSIRTALGASRARLIQQLLTETVLLWGTSAAAGLLIAWWIAHLAASVQPPQISSQSYRVLDLRVILFSVALSAGTALAFGLGPALYASRGSFRVTVRTATPGVRHRRAYTLLIGVQIAVTIVLLTGAAALGKAFLSLLRADGGYDVRSIASMNVSLAGTAYGDSDAASYYSRVLDRIREVPGVVSVSATQSLPLSTNAFPGGRFNVDNAGPPVLVPVISVAPGFFSTIGARVVAGREFSKDDVGQGEALAVVNEQFVQPYGTPLSVVGRFITAERRPPVRIIGVVRGLRYGANPVVEPQIFRLARAPRALTLVARVDGNARDRIALVRDAARSVDPKVPVFDVKTMEERLGDVLLRQRFYALSVAFLSALGLLLAVIGVYGIVACAAAQRTREMGIRLALGTTPLVLRRALLGRTFVTIGVGAAAGAALALVFGRYLQSLVTGADRGLAFTSAAVLVLTAGIAAAAVWSGTRPIARLDIADVLRAESAE